MGKKFTFSNKIKADRERRKSKSSFVPDYLNIGSVPLFSIGVDKDKKDEDDVVEVVLDILPYPVTDDNHMDRDDDTDSAIPGTWWFKKPFRLHRNVGVEDKLVVCPTTWDKNAKCPICIYRYKQQKAGIEYEELKEFSWSSRFLYVVIPRSVTGREGLDFEQVPHVWDVSYGIFQKKLDKELDLNPEFNDFVDLEGGFSLKLRFGKKPAGGFKYMDIERIDFVERKKDIPDSILDEIPELDNVLVKTPIEDIQEMFDSDPFVGEENTKEEDAGEVITEDIPDTVFDNTGVEEDPYADPSDEVGEEAPPASRTRRTLS